MSASLPPLIQEYLLDPDRRFEKRATEIESFLDRLAAKAKSILGGTAQTSAPFADTEKAVRDLETTVKQSSGEIGKQFDDLGRRLENSILAAVNAGSAAIGGLLSQQFNLNIRPNVTGGSGSGSGISVGGGGLRDEVERILQTIDTAAPGTKQVESLNRFINEFGSEFPQATKLAKTAVDQLTNASGTLEERLNRARAAATGLKDSAAAIGGDANSLAQRRGLLIEERRLGRAGKDGLTEEEAVQDRILGDEILRLTGIINKLNIEQRVATGGAKALVDQYRQLAVTVRATGQRIEETGSGTVRVVTPTAEQIAQSRLVEVEARLAAARTRAQGSPLSSVAGSPDERLAQIRSEVAAAEERVLRSSTSTIQEQIAARGQLVAAINRQTSAVERVLSEQDREAAQASQLTQANERLAAARTALAGRPGGTSSVGLTQIRAEVQAAEDRLTRSATASIQEQTAARNQLATAINRESAAIDQSISAQSRDAAQASRLTQVRDRLAAASARYGNVRAAATTAGITGVGDDRLAQANAEGVAANARLSRANVNDTQEQIAARGQLVAALNKETAAWERLIAEQEQENVETSRLTQASERLAAARDRLRSAQAGAGGITVAGDSRYAQAQADVAAAEDRLLRAGSAGAQEQTAARTQLAAAIGRQAAALETLIAEADRDEASASRLTQAQERLAAAQTFNTDTMARASAAARAHDKVVLATAEVTAAQDRVTRSATLGEQEQVAALNQLIAALTREANAARSAQNEIDKNTNSNKTFGGSAKEAAGGGARVHDELLGILATSRLMPAPVSNIISSFGLFTGAARSTAGVVAGLTSLLAGAILSFIQFGFQLNKTTAEVNEMGKGLGLSLLDAKTLKAVAESGGASLQNFAIGLKKINEAISGRGPDAAKTKSFLKSALGANYEIEGKQAIEILLDLAKALQNPALHATNEAEVISSQIFGRSYYETAGALGLLIEDYANVKTSIEKSGIASDEFVRRAEEQRKKVLDLSVAWDKLVSSFGATKAALEVVKVVDSLTDGIAELFHRMPIGPFASLYDPNWKANEEKKADASREFHQEQHTLEMAEIRRFAEEMGSLTAREEVDAAKRAHEEVLKAQKKLLDDRLKAAQGQVENAVGSIRTAELKLAQVRAGIPIDAHDPLYSDLAKLSLEDSANSLRGHIVNQTVLQNQGLEGIKKYGAAVNRIEDEIKITHDQRTDAMLRDFEAFGKSLDVAKEKASQALVEISEAKRRIADETAVGLKAGLIDVVKGVQRQAEGAITFLADFRQNQAEQIGLLQERIQTLVPLQRIDPKASGEIGDRIKEIVALQVAIAKEAEKVEDELRKLGNDFRQQILTDANQFNALLVDQETDFFKRQLDLIDKFSGASIALREATSETRLAIDRRENDERLRLTLQSLEQLQNTQVAFEEKAGRVNVSLNLPAIKDLSSTAVHAKINELLAAGVEQSGELIGKLKELLGLTQQRATIERDGVLRSLDLQFAKVQEIRNVERAGLDLRTALIDLAKSEVDLLEQQGVYQKQFADGKRIDIERERLKVFKEEVALQEKLAADFVRQRVAQAEVTAIGQFNTLTGLGKSPEAAQTVAAATLKQGIADALNSKEVIDYKIQIVKLHQEMRLSALQAEVFGSALGILHRGLEDLVQLVGGLPEPFDKLQGVIKGIDTIVATLLGKQLRKSALELSIEKGADYLDRKLHAAADEFLAANKGFGALVETLPETLKTAAAKAQTDQQIGSVVDKNIKQPFEIVRVSSESLAKGFDALKDTVLETGRAAAEREVERRKAALGTAVDNAAKPSYEEFLDQRSANYGIPRKVAAPRKAAAQAAANTVIDIVTGSVFDALSESSRFGSAKGRTSPASFFASPDRADVISRILGNGLPGGVGETLGNTSIRQMMLALGQLESDFNKKAVGDNGQAFGVFQFHRGTAEPILRKLGKTWQDYLTDIDVQIATVAEFLQKEFEASGNSTRGSLRQFGPRTQQHVFQITGTLSKYGISGGATPEAATLNNELKAVADFFDEGKTSARAAKTSLGETKVDAQTASNEMRAALEFFGDIKSDAETARDEIKKATDLVAQIAASIVEVKTENLRIREAFNPTLPVSGPAIHDQILGGIPTPTPTVGASPTAYFQNLIDLEDHFFGRRVIEAKIAADGEKGSPTTKRAFGQISGVVGKFLEGIAGFAGNLFAGFSSSTIGGKVSGIGGAIGSIGSLFKEGSAAFTALPIVGAIAQIAGGIFDFVGSIFKKRAEATAANIQKNFDAIMQKFKDGSLSLGETIHQMQQQLDSARQQLGTGKIGKKGGKAALVQLEQQAAQQIADLKRQAKELEDKFQLQLKDLRLPPELRQTAQSIRDAFEQVRNYLNSFENAADALKKLPDAREYIDRTFGELKDAALKDLRDLLKQEADAESSFQKSRLAIINEGRIQTPFQEAQDRLSRLFELEKARVDARVKEQSDEALIRQRIDLIDKGFDEAKSILQRMNSSFQQFVDTLNRVFNGGRPLAGAGQTVNQVNNLQFNITTQNNQQASLAGRSIEEIATRYNLISPGAGRINFERPLR